MKSIGDILLENKCLKMFETKKSLNFELEFSDSQRNRYKILPHIIRSNHRNKRSKFCLYMNTENESKI